MERANDALNLRATDAAAIADAADNAASKRRHRGPQLMAGALGGQSVAAALSLWALMIGGGDALARNGRLALDELINSAEFIVIGDVLDDAAAEAAGHVATYRRVATVRLVRSLKGELPETFYVSVLDDYSCDFTLLVPGMRWLLFLKHDGPLLTIVNWSQGEVPVGKSGTVRWFVDPNQPHKKNVETPLTVVEQQIRTRVARSRRLGRRGGKE